MIHFINTHLHHVAEEEHLRVHEMNQLLFWAESKSEPDSIIVIVGDFNANKGGDAYNLCV